MRRREEWERGRCRQEGWEGYRRTMLERLVRRGERCLAVWETNSTHGGGEKALNGCAGGGAEIEKRCHWGTEKVGEGAKEMKAEGKGERNTGEGRVGGVGGEVRWEGAEVVGEERGGAGTESEDEKTKLERERRDGEEAVDYSGVPGEGSVEGGADGLRRAVGRAGEN